MGRKEQEVQDTCVIRGGRQGQGWERWPGLKPEGRVGASGLCARVHMHVCAHVCTCKWHRGHSSCTSTSQRHFRKRGSKLESLPLSVAFTFKDSMRDRETGVPSL